MVFNKVKCPGDHAEGGQPVRGRSGIVPSKSMGDNDGDHGLCGRHGVTSVTIVGLLKCG